MPLLDHFGLIAPYYDRMIKSGTSEKLVTLLGLPVSGRLLDAGGGTGRVSMSLAPTVGQVVVLDASWGMLAQAGTKKGLEPVLSQSERLPFPDGYFSRIIMVDALHHVASQAATAAEMWRVLAPKGRIVIEEPDLRTTGVKFMALFEKVALMRSHFLRPVEIAELFLHTGADVRIEAEDSSAWVVVDKG